MPLKRTDNFSYFKFLILWNVTLQKSDYTVQDSFSLFTFPEQRCATRSLRHLDGFLLTNYLVKSSNKAHLSLPKAKTILKNKAFLVISQYRWFGTPSPLEFFDIFFKSGEKYTWRFWHFSKYVKNLHSVTSLKTNMLKGIAEQVHMLFCIFFILF